MRSELDAQRVDKWLWAARFFKTRSLAAAAVTGGKVQVDDLRVKPARLVRPGSRLSIRRGPMEWEVVVKAITAQRRPAAQAAALYRETDASVARRLALAAEHRAREARRPRGLGRPTKRERRRMDCVRIAPEGPGEG